MANFEDMKGIFCNPELRTYDQRKIDELVEGTAYAAREIVMVGFQSTRKIEGIYLTRRGEVEIEDPSFTPVYETLLNIAQIDPEFLSEQIEGSCFDESLKEAGDQTFIDLGGRIIEGFRRIAITYNID